MPATMRKTKRQVHDPALLKDMLGRGRLLHLAMSRDDQPYLAALSYGFEPPGVIYLHTGRQGLKLEYLDANPRVCFQVIPQWEICPAPVACGWNCRYQSVVGLGRVSRVTGEDERRRGMLAIVRQYAGDGPHQLRPDSLARALVLRLDIEGMTGAARPNPQDEPVS